MKVLSLEEFQKQWNKETPKWIQKAVKELGIALDKSLQVEINYTPKNYVFSEGRFQDWTPEVESVEFIIRGRIKPK